MGRTGRVTITPTYFEKPMCEYKVKPSIDKAVHSLYPQQHTHSRYHSLHPFLSPMPNMADYSGSTRFETLWESALQAYENKTGVALAEHPLALDLQTRRCTDDIATLLQRRAQAFDDIRQRDRMMRAIKTTVSILTPLSHSAPFAGLVRQKALMSCFTSLTFFQTSFPPAKAIQVALGILLDVRAVLQFICRNYPNIQVNQTANCLITSYDVLADLLESIERFVSHLQLKTQVLTTPATDDVSIKSYVDLISTLARVTGKLNSRRSREYSLADALPYSVSRSQIGKELFRGQGHQGGPAEAGSTRTRGGCDYRSSDPRRCRPTRKKAPGR
jgi:hypothetical protein